MPFVVTKLRQVQMHRLRQGLPSRLLRGVQAYRDRSRNASTARCASRNARPWRSSRGRCAGGAGRIHRVERGVVEDGRLLTEAQDAPPMRRSGTANRANARSSSADRRTIASPLKSVGRIRCLSRRAPKWNRHRHVPRSCGRETLFVVARRTDCVSMSCARHSGTASLRNNRSAPVVLGRRSCGNNLGRSGQAFAQGRRRRAASREDLVARTFDRHLAAFAIAFTRTVSCTCAVFFVSAWPNVVASEPAPA